MRQNSFLRSCRISCKMKSLMSLSVLLLSVCYLSIFLANYSPVSSTATYYDNNELFIVGTLTYIGSTNGKPVDNLADGSTHIIYLNAEAERCIAIDPYVTNMSADTVKGWIDDGYEIQIPYSQMLHVTQPHYYNNYERSGTAYYEITVEEIRTNLLYRPDRNNNYITILCGGGLLLLLYTVFKVVRHD